MTATELCAMFYKGDMDNLPADRTHAIQVLTEKQSAWLREQAARERVFCIPRDGGTDFGLFHVYVSLYRAGGGKRSEHLLAIYPI